MLRDELTSSVRPPRILPDAGPAMLAIGSIPINDRLLLAPMSGISDLPFRTISRRMGCGFAFTEMVSARSLVYGNRTTRMLISSCAGDRPLGIQLLGDDPEILRRAIDIVAQTGGFDLIDLNAACPVHKVTRRGEGAGLLQRPDTVASLLSAMVRESPVPVTVKIRSGWDDGTRNALDLALRARDAGVSALFIHGRTKTQGYSGPVDYRIIASVKHALDIPVIASGNGFSPSLIGRMFSETGCDGVAIARGALGNPWIFGQTAAHLGGGTLPERPSVSELAEVMVRHLSLLSDHYGERSGTVRFRKFFAWYTRGIHFARNLKESGFRASTVGEMLTVIDQVKGCAYRDSLGRRVDGIEAVPAPFCDNASHSL